jgi:response regulator RpfG family c-di-GMP phosphodiesterase
MGLLTEHQAARIERGHRFGLILGNYRVLQRLGAGGASVVFLCEHMIMRRRVAIKVSCASENTSSQLVARFYSEMRAVAKLQHPNIVNALDAGKETSSDAGVATIHYFVMEYVPGHNVESHVLDNGPLPVEKACDLIHQIAGALAAAHKHHLIHRDIKPSNIMIGPDGQAKLLDFGLARHFRSRLTDHGSLLGTPDYMAPEQIENANSVDQRTDIFGLGGVLCWCLTGKNPFPSKDLYQSLATRAATPPPSARQLRPDVPAQLDEVIGRMMAPNPDDRYPNAEGVMQALLSFLSPVIRDRFILTGGRSSGEALWETSGRADRRPLPYRVLIVDDDPFTRTFCKTILSQEGIDCDQATTGTEALEVVKEKTYDLLLLDVQMPGMSGAEVCRRLREEPPGPNLKIVMLSGTWKSDDMAQIMLAGANDFLTKPTTKLQLLARVKAGLELKDAQDRSDALNQKLLATVHDLGQSLQARELDILRARKGLVLALAKIGEERGYATKGHGCRLQCYCRALAEEVAEVPALGGQIDQNFIDTLEICAPLRNIGNACLPDHILKKPGKLDASEYLIVQTHTDTGARILQEVAEHCNFSRSFLKMAVNIARHHHERFDGTGYPDGLRGNDIPLAARILAVADAYDAIRCRRSYKPAFTHALAVQKIETAVGQFDPVLVQGFLRCAAQFEAAFDEMAD